MIEPEKRKAIYELHLHGMGKRELARRLNIDRKTVKKIIKEKGEMPSGKRADTIKVDPELLERLHTECDGYKQRMHEKLLEDKEKKIDIQYSTFTRKVRELGIGQRKDSRCDKVPDEPGVEMQHDTSPYTVKLGGVPTMVIASLMYLRYSKRRYLKFYRRFNRFVMKCFFHEALTFWGYVPKTCVIDNTNLARLRGTGKNAVIVPEMALFSKRYGFEFVCHERGHSNRKAGEERAFWTVETNFFPGRKFESSEDLNRQALEWATERMYHRPLTKARVIPAKAFEHERAHLKELPPYIPEPYRVDERGTNQYGYIPFDGNFYWVPGTSRFTVKVIEYSDRLKLYRGRELLREYPLPAEGVKNESFSPPGYPKSRYRRRGPRKPTAQEEKRLRAMSEVVGQYLDAALKPKGIERHNKVRKLFALAQKMTPALFVKSIERALKYEITALETIERIALLYVHEGTDTLPSVEVDESFREREAYLEGNLTDEPDLSAYDTFSEEDHG
jgi:transposase